MVTFRNRRTPSGNCALIPVNTEAVRGWKPGIGNDSTRLLTVASSWQSERPSDVRSVRTTSYRMVCRRSSGPLLGVRTLKPKCGCLSANKGTREARLCMVITQASFFERQPSPMKQTGGGVAVVVRGWESQPHGKGRQDESSWTAEGFTNREGSR